MEFKPSDGFFDLCINVTSENMHRLNNTLIKLYEMGYKTVALNQTIHENIFENDKKKKKKNEQSKIVLDVVPDPIDISIINEELREKICILNRITFICSDSTKAHILAQCPKMKNYDLYAVIPIGQNMLEFACTQLSADLIATRLPTSGAKLNRKLYRQAVGRGLCFEIQYSDLFNQKTRVAALHYAHTLHLYLESSNVIISSGANDANLIRSSYDIINLGFILGLNEMKAKAAILNQCQLLLLRAEKRLSGKAVFTVNFTGEAMEENEEKEDEDF